MDQYAVVINRHAAYMSVPDVEKEFSISRTQVYKLINGIKEEIEAGRYSCYVISGSRVNFYALVDYNKFRDMLTDKHKRKLVPPFDPAAIAEVCGFSQKIVSM